MSGLRAILPISFYWSEQIEQAKETSKSLKEEFIVVSKDQFPRERKNLSTEKDFLP